MWMRLSRIINPFPIFSRFERSSITLLQLPRDLHNIDMAEKYFEHESKRVSKRKRGMSHFQKKNKGAKIPKLGQDDIDSTDYYFENGLRKVYPYFYPFSTFVKGRWIGRTVRDVFLKEFKGVTTFEEDLENNLVKVNGKPVRGDWVLKTQQFLEHITHRHENPVTAVPIDIIADTADLLVINKPSSIPVHPCGRYRFNSLTMLLWKEYGYRNLRTLYRLDRLTSGVLLLPKTTAMSVKLEKQLAAKQLHKEYVCRVEGEFPERTIECKEPLGVISIRMAVSGVRPDGKESHTTFTRLSYNGRSSVIKCIPHTGRTHQIRVHLQYLGFPILNDPVYNSFAFGPQKGKAGQIDKSVTELELSLSRMHNSSEWIIGKNPAYYQLFDSDDTGVKLESSSNIPMGTTVTNTATSPTKICDIQSHGTVNESMNGTVLKSVKNTDELLEKREMTENLIYRDVTESDNDITCTNQSEKDPIENAQKQEDLRDEDENKGNGKSEIEDTNTGDETKTYDVEMKESDNSLRNKSEEIKKCNIVKEANKPERIRESVNSKGIDDSDVDKTDDVIMKESFIAAIMDTSEEVKVNAVVKNTDKVDAANQEGSGTTRVDAVEKAGGWEQYVAKNGFNEKKYVLERTCHMCRNAYKEPQPNEMILFLHAVRYQGPGWEYSTPIPDWAQEDWNLEDQYIVNYDL